MIALERRDFVVQKGYIHQTPRGRVKSNGKLYPPSAYRQLSNGDFLFLHNSASGHLQKIRRMLEELKVPPRTLRIAYRGKTYFLP
jgi:hypothetical protein